jgi:hypothetical protein
MKKKISSVKVTNDVAERAMGLMAEYNKEPKKHNEEKTDFTSGIFL